MELHTQLAPLPEQSTDRRKVKMKKPTYKNSRQSLYVGLKIYMLCAIHLLY